MSPGGSRHSAWGDASGCTRSTAGTLTLKLEPVVRAPGVTLVGLNTAPGVHWFTLTWDPHDVSVVGALRPRQLEHAASVFAEAPASDARVVVMHHNPLRGAISSRIGLLRSVPVMRAFGAMGVDLVLCGHDHQAVGARRPGIGEGNRRLDSRYLVEPVSRRTSVVVQRHHRESLHDRSGDATVVGRGRTLRASAGPMFRALKRLLERGIFDPAQLTLRLFNPNETPDGPQAVRDPGRTPVRRRAARGVPRPCRVYPR